MARVVYLAPATHDAPFSFSATVTTNSASTLVLEGDDVAWTFTGAFQRTGLFPSNPHSFSGTVESFVEEIGGVRGVEISDLALDWDEMLRDTTVIQAMLSGADKITLTGQADVAFGFGGRDRIEGRAGDDRLEGQAGGDRLFGDEGDDDLSGGGGKDRLYGGVGDDTLDGGGGKDQLTGGEGVDLFVFGRGAGKDRIMDFENGVDALAFLNVERFRQIDARQAGDDLVIKAGGAVVKLLDLDLDDFDRGDVIL